MTIRIELSTLLHAPLCEWTFQDISIEMVVGKLQIIEGEEMIKLRDFIESIDTHDDPGGPFIKQIETAALALHKLYAEMEDHPSSMPREELILAGSGQLDRSGQVVPGDVWNLEVRVIVID